MPSFSASYSAQHLIITALASVSLVLALTYTYSQTSVQPKISRSGRASGKLEINVEDADNDEEDGVETGRRKVADGVIGLIGRSTISLVRPSSRPSSSVTTWHEISGLRVFDKLAG